MSKAVIRQIEDEKLSDVLRKENVRLSAREARAIDGCHSMSFTTWVGYVDDRLICAWGVIPPSLLSDEIYLWLHATESVKTSQFLFIRQSQIVIQRLLDDYRAVVGHVKADAKSSKKWLKWLGAEFGPLGIGGLMPFRIERRSE